MKSKPKNTTEKPNSPAQGVPNSSETPAQSADDDRSPEFRKRIPLATPGDFAVIFATAPHTSDDWAATARAKRDKKRRARNGN